MQNVEFALASLSLFEKLVLGDAGFSRAALLGRLHALDLLDGHGRREQPRQLLRRADPRRRPRRPGDRAASRRATTPGTSPSAASRGPTSSSPTSKAVGWKGFRDGNESGVYSSTPLARLNVADGLSTPLAQEHFERFYDRLGARRHERPLPPGAPAHGDALGAAGRAAARGRAHARALARPRDHLAGRPPVAGARRQPAGRHRGGRGAARHADPPLRGGRARAADARRAGRRHHAQPRADRHVDQARGPGASSTGAG